MSPVWTMALSEFGLPAAPQRIDDLGQSLPGIECLRVHAPAGRFLLICSASALGLAFEATLFDLLAEAHYPAPRPCRSRSDSFVAPIRQPDGMVAAACYAWPSGEAVQPDAATLPQLLEVGRLLARLHQLGETHPASVADSADPAILLARAPAGPDRDAVQAALQVHVPSLPSGAVHGCIGPSHVLFIGDRSSSILPSGRACAGGLLLDLCAAAVSWLEGAQSPLAALRSLFSGYQSLRRFHREELHFLPVVLRYAGAREAARRLALSLNDPLAPMRLVAELNEADLRSAAGG